MLKSSLTALILASTCLAAAQSQPEEVRLKVVVNGQAVKFEGQGPVVLERRVYVPMRGVLERIGAEVTYDASQRSVTASGNGRTISLPLDRPTARIDGRAMRLAERPIVMNDRLLVPLRLLSEALGAQVEWSAEDMTVRVTAPEAKHREIVTNGACWTPLKIGHRGRM